MVRKKYCVLFVWMLVLVCPATKASHRAKLKLKELEWNGSFKKYGSPLLLETNFDNVSDTVFLDSFSGKRFMAQFVYAPVFYDNGYKPAFYMYLYVSGNPARRMVTKSMYELKTYEGGMKETDKDGVRHWTGELRYYPDTSVKVERPHWRSDHFTLMVGRTETWEVSRTKNHAIIAKGKRLKKQYFEGHTGEKTNEKYAGKLKDGKIYLIMDPVRYQWGDEVWFIITFRLYLKKADGKSEEILAQKFDSRNPDIAYGEHVKDNAYEVYSKPDQYHMLIRRIYLIPY